MHLFLIGISEALADTFRLNSRSRQVTSQENLFSTPSSRTAIPLPTVPPRPPADYRSPSRLTYNPEEPQFPLQPTDRNSLSLSEPSSRKERLLASIASLGSVTKDPAGLGIGLIFDNVGINRSNLRIPRMAPSPILVSTPPLLLSLVMMMSEILLVPNVASAPSPRLTMRSYRTREGMPGLSE